MSGLEVDWVSKVQDARYGMKKGGNLSGQEAERTDKWVIHTDAEAAEAAKACSEKLHTTAEQHEP